MNKQGESSVSYAEAEALRRDACGRRCGGDACGRRCGGKNMYKGRRGRVRDELKTSSGLCIRT